MRYLTLISVENTKMWKRISTKVMLLIMAVIIIAATGITRYYQYTHHSALKATVSASWKQEEQQKIVVYKATLAQYEKSDSKMLKVQIGSLKKELAEAQYEVDHDVAPSDNSSVWTRALNFDAEAGYGTIIALMMIIVCAAAVAGEFSEGTMKMMISRPYHRWEIISAKFISVLLYGLTLLVGTFVLNFLLMGCLYGFTGLGAKELMWTGSKIVNIPAALKTLAVFGLDFMTVLFYVIVAFAISAISRSRSIATGFSLFLLLVGADIARLVAIYFGWGKFLPFALTSFTTMISNGIYINGTTFGFSVIISAVYALLFLAAGYLGFAKRDI